MNELAPGLYVVATPIGNLRDITLRALDVLAGADLVLCEDTRVGGKLLAAHGIKARLLRYDEHSAERARPQILAALSDGGRVAMTSDAGTPLVSDPGYRLVRDVIEIGAPVFPIPGPSASLAALMVGGLPTDRFLFVGFPPPKSTGRRSLFTELKPIRATLVFFEGGSRLAACLADMADVFGRAPRRRWRGSSQNCMKRSFAGRCLGLGARSAIRLKAPKGETRGPRRRRRLGTEAKRFEDDIDAALLDALSRARARAGQPRRSPSALVAFTPEPLRANALVLRGRQLNGGSGPSRPRTPETSGRLAEVLCALWLMAQGLSAARLSFADTPIGEIDLLVAQGLETHSGGRGEATRDDTSRRALDAVSWRQRERLRRAALNPIVVASTCVCRTANIRLDLIALAPGRLATPYSRCLARRLESAPQTRERTPCSLKVAIQMDPPEGINIATDTTFMLMMEAQAQWSRALGLSGQSGWRWRIGQRFRARTFAHCHFVTPWAIMRRYSEISNRRDLSKPSMSC